MFSGLLSSLDIPSDGSAKLVKIETTYDDSGIKTWTVVFRETKASKVDQAKPQPEEPIQLQQKPAIKSSAPIIKTDGWAASLQPWSKLSPTATLPSSKIQVAPPAMMDRIFPLKCQVKTYAWGKLGNDSLVGVLAANGLEELEITPAVPYAELWMGTHPSGPSMVMLSSPCRVVTPLSEWIKLNPSLLGPSRANLDVPKLERRQSMRRLTATSLPFLFKILSVRTALSIQAHPDKELGAKLHARQPDMYKDDNHKPEMAVAITPFEALCSFQPAYSILENCRATPELVALIGEDSIAALDDAANARAQAERPHSSGGTPIGVGEPEPDHKAAFKGALRTVFSRLINAPVGRVTEQLDALMSRIASTNKMLRAPVDVLAMRLHEQYPGDVGVFCAYLLNYKQLQPGEALFLGANEPHAYISGDCAEVMATSDNVVRAGLTPKWKDVDTLVNCLTYKDSAPDLITPSQSEGEPHVWRYTPPAEVDEFVLDRVEMPSERDAATLTASPGLAVVIVIRGVAQIEQLDDVTEDTVGLRTELSAGSVHLVCPHTVLRIKALQGPCLLFRAAAKDLSDIIDTGVTKA